MNKTTLKQSLAILLNLTLVGTSFADVGGVGAAPVAAMPDFVKVLTPPEQLGFVTDSFQGQTSKPVVLIQDLHGNYGVQKKIEAILKYLQPLVAQGGRTMALGVEGAWGDIDLTSIRKRDPRVRQVAGEFLMKEAEISGMDKFAMNSESPVNLVGIDNPEDYILHRDLVRKSLVVRLALAQKVEKLRAAVDANRVDAPSALRHLWRIDDEFHAGKIDLPQLSKELGVAPLQNYGQAEAALAQRKNELADSRQTADGVYMSNLVRADQDLQLLSRLLRQQLTMEEVQYVTSRTKEMLVVIQSLLPGENMDQWKEAIRSAVDYYAIALVRDKPLSEHAFELAEKNSDMSVVVVTGGFHTAGISQYFKEKKVSYIVIAPAVESHTDYDEALYIKRIMGIHLSQAEMIQKGLARMAAKSVQAMAIVDGLGTVVSPAIRPADLEQGAAVRAGLDTAEGVITRGLTPEAMMAQAGQVAADPATVQLALAESERVTSVVEPGAPAPQMSGELASATEELGRAVTARAGVVNLEPVNTPAPVARPSLVARAANAPVIGPVVRFFTGTPATPSQQAHSDQALQHDANAEQAVLGGNIELADAELDACSFCPFIPGGRPKQAAMGEGGNGGGGRAGVTTAQVAAAEAPAAERDIRAGVPQAVAVHNHSTHVEQKLQITPEARPTDAEVSPETMHANARTVAGDMRGAEGQFTDPVAKAIIGEVAGAVESVGAMGPQSGMNFADHDILPQAAPAAEVTQGSVKGEMHNGGHIAAEGQPIAGHVPAVAGVASHAFAALISEIPGAPQRKEVKKEEEEAQAKLEAPIGFQS